MGAWYRTKEAAKEDAQAICDQLTSKGWRIVLFRRGDYSETYEFVLENKPLALEYIKCWNEDTRRYDRYKYVVRFWSCPPVSASDPNEAVREAVRRGAARAQEWADAVSQARRLLND